MTRQTAALSRRMFCAATLAAMTGARASVPSLADDVQTYIGFGEHRAGMATEEPTARWIAQRLENSGYQTELQRFPIRTILDPGGKITAANISIDLFPQWLPPAGTLGAPVNAPLLPLSADKGEPSIRLMTTPSPLSGNWGSAQDALVADAVSKGALALILAPDDPTGNLYVSNQHTFAPLPIPVGLMARRALSELAAIAERNGATGTFLVSGTMADASAINVVGRKTGRGKTIVISTPLTGWFHCGGERGPGVAVLLRIASEIAMLDNPVLVLGTGSHEIGHLGMEHALKHGAPAPSDVAIWFHFGASLATTKLDAARGVTSPQFVVGTVTSEAWLRPAFAPLVRGYANGNARTPGESGQVIGAGHTRFAGMVGTFPTFHTPADRGEAIDYALLDKIAAASADVIKRAAVE